MKKLFFVFASLCTIIVWVLFVGKIIIESDRAYRSILYGFILAPILEEFIFRYKARQLAVHYNCAYAVMWISAYVFAIGHTGGYSHFPWHNAIMVQGVFALMAWQVNRYHGFWAACLFHSFYNITVHFIF